MHLPLERIPPMISHASCIFLGLFLSFYLNAEKPENQCFLPEKIFISFPKSYFSKESHSPPIGKIHFGIRSAHSTCLLKNSSAVVVQNDSFIVAVFNLKSAEIASEILNPKNKGRLVLLSDAALNSSPTCFESKIKYGS